MDKLRVGHLSTFYHTAFVLMGTDWLAEAGIEATWRLFPSGPDIVGAFGAGEIDLAYIGLPPAMIGIDRGTPIRCIAGGHEEGTVLVAPGKYASVDEAGGIEAALAQFSVIGCPPKGSIHDIILRDLLRTHGLEARVDVRNFAWADFALAALQDSEVDAAIGTPALAVGARRFAGGKIIVPPAMLWPHNPSYGIVATWETTKRQDAVLGFLEAHEAATMLIRNKPGAAAKIVSRVTSIVDEGYVLECYQVSPRYCAALSPEFVAATMRFAEVLHGLGYTRRVLAMAEVFDRRFIDRVHPEPPHYG